MSSTFFSIIIPTFNSGKTLAASLQSILSQTFTDYEILIIDGVSEDDTLNIAKSYNDERIKIQREKDKGIYDAMNKGIEKATGEWLYFLGSDDEIAGSTVFEYIFNQLQHLKEKVIYGNVLIKGDTGWAKDGEIYDGEFTIGKLLEKNIAHQSIFYNKCVFKKCGNYNLKYTVCADYDFNLKVAANYKMRYIDYIICNFYSGGQSTSTTDLYMGKDYEKNVVDYFSKSIYKEEFKAYRPYIVPTMKAFLYQLKLIRALQLFAIKVFMKLNFKFF